MSPRADPVSKEFSLLPARWRRARPGRGRRVAGDESGSAAVEFAVIAPVFFFLMFVIAETALVFIAEQVMDNAVFETARLIRTGQVQGTMSTEEFQTEVCNRMSVFVDCDGGDFYLEVKAFGGFEELKNSMNASPTDEEEEFKDPGAFDFGEPSEVVLVRAYYQWPTNAIFGSLSLKNMANGKRLIGSFAAFRNEPFPSS
jgi:Flp pilus assembly protein TadG